MNESDAVGALLTLAEIGIGLVGFAGLILAVTRRASTMSRIEVVQLRELIRAGLGVLALAFVPVGALLVGATGPTLWRTASRNSVLHTPPVLPAIVSAGECGSGFVTDREVPR